MKMSEMQKAKEVILNHDRIIIGAGAGLSASGGLNYFDIDLVNKIFPEYARRGFKSLLEIQGAYWRIEDSDPKLYWGVWAKHIWNIRYASDATKPYVALKSIINNKNYFIITTNADGQFGKSGFSSSRIFAPQGNYDQLQCAIPCSEETYYNESIIRKMVESIYIDTSGLPAVHPETIPTCPNCGAMLKPNLRCDNTFVETPHMKNGSNYIKFINESISNKTPTLLIEAGVGFNTPGIIRYPFEKLVEAYPFFTLLRVNLGADNVPDVIRDRSVCLDVDIVTLFEYLL